MLQSEEEDERSSVYSHPSLLDGGMNFGIRPNYSPVLASTPENPFLNDAFLALTEEMSSEVRRFTLVYSKIGWG